VLRVFAQLCLGRKKRTKALDGIILYDKIWLMADEALSRKLQAVSRGRLQLLSHYCQGHGPNKPLSPYRKFPLSSPFTPSPLSNTKAGNEASVSSRLAALSFFN
jgi:hypothetical protein